MAVNDRDEDVAYLYLPTHPRVVKEGIVKRTESLRDYMKDYNGPDFYFDFDQNGTSIGIEL